MLTLFYERVSTDKQKESGLGLEAQRKRNAQAAAMFHREPPNPQTNVYLDDDVSAGVPFGNRVAGIGLMARIRDEVDGLIPAQEDVAIITYDLYRLFRDVDDGRAMLKWLDARDVKVILSNEGGNAIDSSTAMGRFLITVRLATGELERGLTGERTKAALGALQARGGKVGEAPYGWRAVGDGAAKHVVDPQEQEIIARILNMDASGLSMRAIAQQLNNCGLGTRDGKLFSHVQVSRILQRAEESE